MSMRSLTTVARRNVDALDTAEWPPERAEEALEALARAARLGRGEHDGSRGCPAGGTSSLAERLPLAADRLGVEVERVELNLSELAGFLAAAGPAIVPVPAGDGGRILALLARRGARLELLTPNGRRARIRTEVVARALAAAPRAAAMPEVERLLAPAGLSAREAGRAREALLGDLLQGRRIAGGWLLRSHPGMPFARQLAETGFLRHGLRFACFHTAGYALLLGSWWAVGRGALGGQLPAAWLALWGLLLLALMPMRMGSLWAQASATASLGAALKSRLLAGSLGLDPDELRHQGAGQLLGRVLEAEAFEHYALMGGFLTLGGGLDLVLAAAVLARGSAAGEQLVLLALWVALSAAIALFYARRRHDWTNARLALTNEVVEGIVGQRTRLVQEPPEHWHRREDRRLAEYVELSRRMDRGRLLLLSLVPRGWLVLATAGLGPAFLDPTTPRLGLALAVGGALAAFRGFQKVSEGVAHGIGAAICGRDAVPLARSVSRGPVNERASAPPPPPALGPSTIPLLETKGLVFRHARRHRPVLDGIDLSLRAGDRVLLTGASGGGKSTLAAVLCGARTASEGLLLLEGLDRPSHGASRWRQRIAAVPQFHENHVFAGTLAFNLLLGRAWPPGAEDLREAEAICLELGLGGLLSRMPCGLQQIVGETGWQLSHGERSRIFVARALLQRAEVLVLDESLGALDPETAETVLDCTLRRAPALILVSHP